MNVPISGKLGRGRKKKRNIYYTVNCAETDFKRQLAFDYVCTEVQNSAAASTTKLKLIKEYTRSSYFYRS